MYTSNSSHQQQKNHAELNNELYLALENFIPKTSARAADIAHRLDIIMRTGSKEFKHPQIELYKLSAEVKEASGDHSCQNCSN